MALLITFFVFVVSLLQAPLQTAGWLWDSGNALGMLGFAGLTYLFLEDGAGRGARRHQWISYATTGAIFAHIILLWAFDATVWYYLMLSAPNYMLAGIAAFFGVICIILLALPTLRRKWHPSRKQFQTWHYCLSLAVLTGALWHITASGFYFSQTESFLLIGLSILIIVANLRKRLRLRREMLPKSMGQFKSNSLSGIALCAGFFVTVFVLLKGLA